MVLLLLLVCLMSGLGSAFGTFWCLSGAESCAPGKPCALRCLPHSGGTASLTSAGHLLDEDPCGSSLETEYWLPVPKPRIRHLRTTSAQPDFPSSVRSACISPDPDLSFYAPGLPESSLQLAQRHLRSVVMLN